MKDNKEFIESLSRMIKTKRVSLGIESSILEIKSLLKYRDLEAIEVPSKFDAFKNVRMKYLSTDFEEYQSAIYNSYKDSTRAMYIFSKIISEVSKKVATDLVALANEDNGEVKINEYIKTHTDFKHLNIELAKEVNDDTELLSEVLERTSKSEPIKVKVTNSNPEAKNKAFYGTIDCKLNQRMIGNWYRRSDRSKEIEVRDLVWIISLGRVIKDSCNYFKRDIERARDILFKKMYPNRIFEDNLSLYDTVEKLDSASICNEIEKKKYYQMPESLVDLINNCMALMLEESNAILDYVAGIKKDMDSKYAASYETKAHITKKVQDFMKNNSFLEMFGYVEADEMCDLEKLNKINDEFIELSTLLPLPVSKQCSLRFRRLGKNKAAGIYFAFAKALCVDINSPDAFIHEMFHMIDFNNGLLSLDYKFKSLAARYKRVVTQSIEELGSENPVYTAWMGKGKYNKDYFLNNKEIFARLGELYVSEILNIKSSLNQREYNKDIIDKYVYPMDNYLLSAVKTYYDELFEDIKSKSDTVNFLKAQAEILDETVNNKTELEEEYDKKAIFNDSDSLILAPNNSEQLSFLM